MSNTFSASIKIVILFLSFSVNMMYYINCFAYIELSLYCWNKSHLTMVCDATYVCLCVCVWAQLCPTLCSPLDCSQPCSSAHGIFQARILVVGHFLLQGFYKCRDQTHISYLSLTGMQVLCHYHHLGRPLHIYVCSICVCIYIYMCVCVRIYIYICLYVHSFHILLT